MPKIWEGTNTKNADLDVKSGPLFILPVLRAAFLPIKYWVAHNRDGGAKIFYYIIVRTHDKELKIHLFAQKSGPSSKAGGGGASAPIAPPYVTPLVTYILFLLYLDNTRKTYYGVQ